MNRVWIYQADRFLDKGEISAIQQDLDHFVQSWTAHGSALAGKASVVEGLFIVLEVDESQAGVTGCSIDKSVHFLKALSNKYTVDFFDRMKVSYRSDDNKVHLVSRATFEDLLKSGVVTADTIVFNNLISEARQLETEWQIPFKDSWHKQVFN